MALTKISTAMISQSAAAVDLNVDAGTFYVDTTNNRVGVGGKTDPDTPLHVIGTATATTFAGSGASLTSIPNSALVNSSITINSTAVSLGGSLTLTTANIAENTNLYYTDARADARIAAADTDDLSEGSSNLYYTDARVDARVSGGSLGNITTTGYIRGPATFTLDPAAHGDNTGTVVIAGNLQVDGTTTTINSTTMTVDDKNITLASGSANAAAADGAGFTVDIGTGTNPAITYDGTNDEWDFNKPLNVTGNIVVSGTVDGVDIAARDAVLTSTTTTAGAALPKAGGTMTGTLAMGANPITSSGIISAGEVNIATTQTNQYPLDLGSTAASQLVLQRWQTSAGTGKMYIVAYGASHASEAGNFAIKNVVANRDIYFQLAGSVEPLRLTSTGATFAGNITVGGTVDGVDIAARDAVLTSTTTTAGAALPKAGGTMTGDIFINGGSTTERNVRIQNTGNVLYAGVEGSSGNRFVGSSAGNAFFGTTSDSGLEFATHNNVRMVIDGDGNATFSGTISSGAITSTGKVQGNSLKAHVGTDDGSQLNLFADGSGHCFIAGHTLSFNVGANNGRARKMIITSTGNVGIGTDAAPVAKLHIHETVSSGTGIMLTNNTNTSGTYSDIRWQYSSTDASYASGIRFKQVDTSHGGQLEFYTDSATGSYTQRMTITENGSVIVGSGGTTTHGAVLQVAGDITTTVDGNAYQLYYTESRDFITNSGATAIIKQIDNDSINAKIDFKSWTNSTLMTIMNSGNVLVGTTSNNYNRGKFTVFGTPGNPATTGTNVDNVAIRVATTTGNSQSFDIGMYNSGDYGAWLQASNSGSLDSHSPIVLNPNGGNVGIGTAAPDHPLEVVGAISSADTGVQKATFANVGNDLVMTANAGETNVSSNIIFKSSQSGGSAAERMRIGSDGKTTFHHNVKISGASSYSAANLAEANNENMALHISPVRASVATGISIGDFGSVSGIQTYHNTTNAALSLVLNPFGGGVGIGTTSPTSKLTVNGQITGGFGGATTAGNTDWNHSTNARAGMGYTLLLGNHTNGPSGAANYFHCVNYEYGSKNGSGNMTQVAIGYNVTTQYIRYRYGGSWSSWTQT